jgi:hypothetical protein
MTLIDWANSVLWVVVFPTCAAIVAGALIGELYRHEDDDGR